MLAFRRFCYLLLVVLLFALGACSKNVTLYRQALKEYKKGDFETSLSNNIQSLQLKPYYAKAQDLIKKTYATAIAGRESRILKIEEAAQSDMWDQLTIEYLALINIQNSINPINPLVSPKSGQPYTFEKKDYESKLARCKEGAAEFHYSTGLAQVQSSINPDIQREAALEFKTALAFVPNYKDAAARYEAARRLAIKRIAILTFEDKSGARHKYGGLIDLLTDTIIARLVQDRTIQEFMEIVTRDQMEVLLQEQQMNPGGADNITAASLGTLLGVHEVLTGKLIQINYIPDRTTYLDLKDTKNIVVTTETYTDDRGKEKTREIKGDVTCNYRKFTKFSTVKIIASFNMLEISSGKVKLQDTVNAEFPWTESWARVTSGDERALSDATKELINKEEPFPPFETDMVNYTLSLVGEKIVARVRDYLLD